MYLEDELVDVFSNPHSNDQLAQRLGKQFDILSALLADQHAILEM